MSIQTIYKTKKIITVGPEDSLTSALSQLSSSHDAAFVFERAKGKKDKKVFLGVVNPYHCLVLKSYPANTHVKHCLIHPPRLEVDDSVNKAARLMIESKIHYLPVFEKSEFIAILTARRLLGYAKDSGALTMKISQRLKNKKPPIFVFENDSLAQALSHFKNERISKLIVLSKDFKLKGVLSYYDLLPHLTTPRERQGSGARVGDTTASHDRPVKHFMKTQVITLTGQNFMSDAAHLILEHEIGSVIITDRPGHPVGIITTRDILEVLAPPQQHISKLMFLPQDLPRQSMHFARQFALSINKTLSKLPNVSSAKFTLKGNPVGGVFEAILSIFKKQGELTVIKKQGKNLKKVLQDVKKTSKNVVTKK